jgi:membrane protease YdiL (CAAX protease family)
MLVFLLQKKNLKYEFRHRIIPDHTRYRNKYFGFRFADASAGFVIGILFYKLGGYISVISKWVVTSLLGEAFYLKAQDGSVNTTPPPPPPNPLLIWTLIVLGVLIQFIFVAISEEYCFRGVLLKEFGHISQILGIIVSSLIFMIYHVFPGIVPLETFITFGPYYFCFGVLLCFCTIVQKGDLITAIVAHGTFNSIIWVTRYLQFL